MTKEITEGTRVTVVENTTYKNRVGTVESVFKMGMTGSLYCTVAIDEVTIPVDEISGLDALFLAGPDDKEITFKATKAVLGIDELKTL